MESIKKQGLRDLISKHERALPTLSNAVEQLRTAGLEISDNVIKDLADNQSAETKSARGNGMGGKIARLRRTPTTQSDNRQAGFISQAHRWTVTRMCS